MAKVVVKEFDNEEEVRSEICRRARHVLGYRGYKNSSRLKVCVNGLHNLRKDLNRNDAGKLVITDDKIAEYACNIASDTQFHSIEYF